MVKRLAQAVALIAATRITWIITKPLIAWAYNRYTPDIDWDAIEDDGMITVHPELRA